MNRRISIIPPSQSSVVSNNLMTRYTYLIASIIVLVSCKYQTTNQSNHSDTLQKVAKADTINTKLPSGKKNDLREFGDRVNVLGDFDGDGKVDTVFESYISKLTGKETRKIFDSTDWDNNVD